MTYDPQPYIAAHSGSADEAPSDAKPIALYGAGSGDTVYTGDIISDELFRTGSLTGDLSTLTETAAAIMMLTEEISETELVTTITGLQAAVDGKAATSHTHSITDVNELEARLAAIESRLDTVEAA